MLGEWIDPVTRLLSSAESIRRFVAPSKPSRMGGVPPLHSNLYNALFLVSQILTKNRFVPVCRAPSRAARPSSRAAPYDANPPSRRSVAASDNQNVTADVPSTTRQSAIPFGAPSLSPAGGIATATSHMPPTPPSPTTNR